MIAHPVLAGQSFYNMTFTLDLLCLVVAVAGIAVLIHLWVERCPPAFPAWLERKSHWWYTFCFCRPCLALKLSCLTVFFIRPLSFMAVMPYPAWTATEYLLNVVLIYFSSIVFDGLLFQQALKNIYYESVRYFKLVEQQKKERGEHA